jgi:hypothetical protein
MADQGTAAPPSNGDGDLEGELARLREEITTVRRTRMAIERSTRRRTTVEIAIETTMRDRDAGTTPLLAELRQQGQALSERLLELWANADWLRGAVARLNAGGFTLDSDPNIPAGRVLIDQLLAEELHRERARQLLDEAGVVTLRVPTVAPCRSRPATDETASLWRSTKS